MPAMPRLPRAGVAAICALLLLAGAGLRAQITDLENLSVDPEAMEAFLTAEGRRLADEAWERIGSREKLEAQRDRLHREFMFMIGLDPLPERTPLQATVVRTIDRGEYTVEVLYFQSLPGCYVTANLYKPAKGRGPFPALVWGPGHSADEFGAKALRQEFAIPWVRGGYICLVIDPIQVAEVFGVHRGTHAWEHYDWFSRGYTPIGIEVWNAMRGVDYLLGRPDVDGRRLTINGVSGGGHLSWMTGAADPRIAVIQPAAATASVADHIGLDLQRMACDCAYFINTYRHDWTTLAALIVPRPLLLHCSTGDAYYPSVSYNYVFERTKTIFSWFGIPEKTAMVEVGGPHDYYQPQREQAVQWSDRWLKGKKTTVRERPFERIPPSELAALGGQFGAHPENINSRIQELLVPRATLARPAGRAAWETKRQEVLRALREVVFRNRPAVRWSKVAAGEHGAAVLETEPGIRIGVISYVPESDGPKQDAILLVASGGDTEDGGMWNFMKAYPFAGYASSRHQVWPRGIGADHRWNWNRNRRYQRSAMLLGRTVDEMRLHDVLCAVDYLASRPDFSGRGLTLAGRGEAGIIAAYAALLDERVTRVILKDPPASHTTGPLFLNVLRYTDIPQALALLAPRELVFLSEPAAEFDYTRDIYELQGAPEKFRRCVTVPEALNLPPRVAGN